MSLSLNYKPVQMILKTGSSQIICLFLCQTVSTISMEILIDGEIVKEVENQKLLGVITH